MMYCVAYMCIPIGPNGEPKVTHGYTLVSELTLVEVAETINVSIYIFFFFLSTIITFTLQKYAFNTSYFPLILSLENHCSKEQQVCVYTFYTILQHFKKFNKCLYAMRFLIISLFDWIVTYLFPERRREWHKYLMTFLVTIWLKTIWLS